MAGGGFLVPLLVEMVEGEGGGPARQAALPTALLLLFLLLVDDRGERIALGEGQQGLLGRPYELLQVPCVSHHH